METRKILPWAVLLTCEHASPALPPELVPVFEARHAALCARKSQRQPHAPLKSLANLLASHRAWDPGALPVAKYWAERWQAQLFTGQVSRLVCDLNRTLDNPHLWSAYTNTLPEAQKNALLTQWYLPHWKAVRQAVDLALIPRTRVLHVAVHSFTPVLNGRERLVDMGLLHHPHRPLELALAKNMQRAYAQTPKPQGQALRLYRNAPYYGHTNSLVQFLRTQYAPEQYVGLEIEFNQALLAHGPYPAQMLAELLEQALQLCPKTAL